jgi:hypothetical protein
MGVTDDRWSALFARYGDPADPLGKSVNDMLAELRAEFGLENGAEWRDFLVAFGSDGLTDAEVGFWAAGAVAPADLDGGAPAGAWGYTADNGLPSTVSFAVSWEGGVEV